MKRRNFLAGLLLSPLSFLLGHKCEAKENSLPTIGAKESIYARFKWENVYINRKEFTEIANKFEKIIWISSDVVGIERLKQIAIEEYVGRAKSISGKNCTCIVNKGSDVIIIFGKVDVSQYTYTKQMVKVAKLVASRY